MVTLLVIVAGERGPRKRDKREKLKENKDEVSYAIQKQLKVYPYNCRRIALSCFTLLFASFFHSKYLIP